ncbi:MAG: (2Fe-2S)-binding protein, partial [Ilumatobacteraceae bacterium]
MREIGTECTLTVNGAAHEVSGLHPGESLLDALRERCGLRGSKGACEEGECGSCTVLVDGVAVCSCLTMAASVEGCSITTVEGVGAGDLSDLQDAFLRAGAVQCGFCTPGFVMSMYALLRSKKTKPTELEIEEALGGNLCRCTGYRPILEGFRTFARNAPDSAYSGETINGSA